MKIQKKNYEIEFENYISNYDKSDPNIMLKINHTYRVKDLCREIATRLCLSKGDIELAEFIGLYHDIGRFKQLTDFNTYDDSASFDHGDYGADLLTKNDFIQTLLPNYSKEVQKEVIFAIRYHNKFSLPDEVSSFKKGYLCKIIRDADKIDIYKAVSEENVKDLFFEFKPEDLVISDVVKTSFYNRRTISKECLKTKVDNIVTMLAFVYDINYGISKDILLRSGNLEKYVNAVVNAPDIKQSEISKQILEMYNYLIYYLMDY